MRSICCVFVALLCLACAREDPRSADQWEPVEIELAAHSDHDWWEFPVKAEFTHEATGRALTLEAYWSGPRLYTLRFAAPESGRWRYVTRSRDGGLDAKHGSFEVAAIESSAIRENPNLRGPIQIAGDQRTFAYADGTPVFLLADTLWAGNTARAGLGENNDGPFFEYLADRKAKGFNTVLMQMFHGFGDYPQDPDGQRNEGGHLFGERDFTRINPRYFEYADLRWKALWRRGWIVAAPFGWWGKTKTCRFTPEEARRLASYMAVRYGAFNSIWAVSGEYQYTFSDCGWTADDINAIAREVQAHNPYHRPLSIHPSGRERWDPPEHGVQSSRAFNGSGWLDHHWLQTGQSVDRLYNIPRRALEVRALQPRRPVFCSEGYYERASDRDTAYHARWEVWSALLNGCAGYGYGAQGLWQFYDPEDQEGEPGKSTGEESPWREAMAFPGSGQVGYVRDPLAAFDWTQLVPKSGAVLIDGKPSPAASDNDISPPQIATVPGLGWILYIPRGNAGKKIAISGMRSGSWKGAWLDPRTGERTTPFATDAQGESWQAPPPPEPQEDWVLLLDR